MKANELFIGNLLILKSNGKLPDSIVRIREIHIDGCFVDVLENNIFEPCDNFIDYSELSPIPLTKDMLQANGFERLRMGGREYLVNYSAKIMLFDGCYVTSLLGGAVFIRSVHKLQHALRLSGFNELADNFKIE